MNPETLILEITVIMSLYSNLTLLPPVKKKIMPALMVQVMKFTRLQSGSLEVVGSVYFIRHNSNNLLLAPLTPETLQHMHFKLINHGPHAILHASNTLRACCF